MENELECLRRKVAELENGLKQSEGRFNTIFNAASNPMTITTIKDGRMIDANDACARLTGYAREEMVGTISAERSIWADPKQRDMMIQKLQTEGRVHNLEASLFSRTGELRKVLFSADPLTMNDESCLLGVLIDITEREKKADALRESEDKYRTLVEHSLQGFAIIQNDQIAFCNSAYAAMTGYSVEELLSFPSSKALIHAEDQEFVLQRSHDRLMGKSVPPHYEHRIVRKDGKTRWLEIHATAMGYEGKPAIQLACIDITERKQAEKALRESEEYLRQIINCIGDAIFVMDRQHRLILLNEALCEFAGKQREEVLGKGGDQFLPKELAQSLWEQEEIVFNTGRDSVTEEQLRDGQENLRTFMTRKSLLTDQSGNQQIVGVMRDITEYKRLESQFMQSQKMEAIGVLAGGVAHDFNNLLTAINGYCELALESLDPKHPVRGDLEQVRNAGQRAASLTSQLLAFGRKQIFQLEIMDLNAAITQMSSMLRRLIGEDIELVSITQPGLGLINADPGQIQQIIMNLAVNARDAMPEGGKLTIETADVDFDVAYMKGHPAVKAGPYVMLAITDSGIGMDEATKARLFEPFFTTKEKGKGTGLGLSTVYGIVKQSNGFVWVYSEPERGTTFKVYFPRVVEETARIITKEISALESAGSETVLLVEDEPLVRAFILRILQDRGYSVLDASGGQEALAVVEQYAGNIHLVITDVIMPGMSGKDLVLKLKARRPGIKALFISGYTDNVIVHHGILDSGVYFLQKPFKTESLARKVREVLNS
jgi:two-component system, cell cycle sensor histidine kinase and response regulator CckA